ncbi:ADP-ribosylglycohydrolase family protein [Hymenobacter yonginensis]|uniref:ADP-ribosylglycohydrolase family protein n=1 Tax=Hymenobacter yonginensis TaxID=748197 RepID=A0ABY7PUU9_9BACT|nr:ADP-ribosylglycohydrolase family protein [Hymenobacter yonginensis]WBO86712.1 ADP-ribosylglycohydrolase family protein [Hymenobacter yonginensis]
MTTPERLAGCVLAGAIGDAWGSGFENLPKGPDPTTFYLQPPPTRRPVWQLTDDTQLTLVTLEALCQGPRLAPATLANHLVAAYAQGRLTGLGASTLKALRELQAGGHWSRVGREGEYGAGNGAAMRIAPFAFWPEYDRAELHDFCHITHRHVDAYVGALAVVLALRAVLSKQWTGPESLLDLLVPQLPDTRLRDRLLEIQALPGSPAIADVARLGTSGYVVDSVPFALFCAAQVPRLGLSQTFAAIIAAGGDTDTNASLAGQIAGALLGPHHLPPELLQKLARVDGYAWVNNVLQIAQQHVV